MDSLKSPTGSARRHGRNISQPLVRRCTKGPLDAVDDPLAGPDSEPEITSPKSPAVASPSSLVASTISAEAAQSTSPLPRPALAQRPKPVVDVRFLQDHNSYHQIPTDDIPAVFLKAEHQPPANAPISDLVQNGHFRRAAAASLSQIMQSQPNDAERIFELLYTRLACLVLISRPDLAAQEAIPLTDFLARGHPSARDIIPLIPWELRLILVRLQSMGATDGGRRGIMSLYGLASEVRSNIRLAQTDGDKAELSLLQERLQDLGLRVADALVEMGELETAVEHLGTLVDVDPDEIAYRKALLHIRVGDVNEAKRCAEEIKNADERAALFALLLLVNGDTMGARDEWRRLVDKHPSQSLLSQNLAVSMLYTGHIMDARKVLEDVVNQSPPCSGILFNLSTVYELCSERAVEQKTNMLRAVAAKKPTPDSGGWERPGFDFKL